jgi:hypothetical protein
MHTDVHLACSSPQAMCKQHGAVELTTLSQYSLSYGWSVPLFPITGSPGD